MDEFEVLNREAEISLSKQDGGHEWEVYKENVRPLKEGRKVKLLNQALKAQQRSSFKNSFRDERRKLIQAIDEYCGDDPLKPWIECIKWVRESFPSGGDKSGLQSWSVKRLFEIVICVDPLTVSMAEPSTPPLWTTIQAETTISWPPQSFVGQLNGVFQDFVELEYPRNIFTLCKTGCHSLSA